MNDEPENDLRGIMTSDGQDLRELSNETPILVVFLRHSGCPFCRQTLADLEKRRAAIEAAGAEIVLVHMIASDSEAEMFFACYRLHDVRRISDPRQEVYKRFGLGSGGIAKVVGIGVWWPGLKSVLRGHLPGKPVGDIFQMPGAFLVDREKVVCSFQARNSAGRADYVEIVSQMENSAGC